MTATDAAPRRGPRSERPAKGDLREQALLDAARRLLDVGEFADASTADLARAAGISRAAFYFYFASKQALLASVVDEAVATFNARILEMLPPRAVHPPADALRLTLEAAASLWWEHRAVMAAGFELGTAMPAVYERTMGNFRIVLAPTVALLREYGTVPEAAHEEDANGLAIALMLMTERNLYDLMRGTPSAADRDRLVRRLVLIWTRAFGFPSD